MTLIEVILAGSIAVLMTLALLEGIIVSTKISHENAQLLAAEGYAWETAWRWLSKASNDLVLSGCRWRGHCLERVSDHLQGAHGRRREMLRARRGRDESGPKRRQDERPAD